MKLTLLNERGKEGAFAVVVGEDAGAIAFSVSRWYARAHGKHYAMWAEARGMEDGPKTQLEYASAMLADGDIEATCLSLSKRDALECACEMTALREFPHGFGSGPCERILDAKGRLIGYVSGGAEGGE